jgi:hypothetical protein
MNIRSAISKFEVRLGNVRDIFANTETDFMYWVFKEAQHHDSIAEWLREVALDQYYKERTNATDR